MIYPSLVIVSGAHINDLVLQPDMEGRISHNPQWFCHTRANILLHFSFSLMSFVCCSWNIWNHLRSDNTFSSHQQLLRNIKFSKDMLVWYGSCLCIYFNFVMESNWLVAFCAISTAIESGTSSLHWQTDLLLSWEPVTPALSLMLRLHSL